MSAEGTVRDGNGATFFLIETMRWERAGGFVRLDRHLARLRRSAAELGFACEPARVHEALDNLAPDHDVMRVRLTLSRDGSVACSASTLVLDRATPWKLRVTSVAVASTDPLLRHKTSRRELYEAARSEFTQQDADEVLLLNERGEVCEGTITTVFAEIDGRLATPRLACGLLAGVLRAELLETGRAEEAVLRLDDLHRAKALYVGNSLRGLIPGRLT